MHFLHFMNKQRGKRRRKGTRSKPKWNPRGVILPSAPMGGFLSYVNAIQGWPPPPPPPTFFPSLPSHKINKKLREHSVWVIIMIFLVKCHIFVARTQYESFLLIPSKLSRIIEQFSKWKSGIHCLIFILHGHFMSCTLFIFKNLQRLSWILKENGRKRFLGPGSTRVNWAKSSLSVLPMTIVYDSNSYLYYVSYLFNPPRNRWLTYIRENHQDWSFRFRGNQPISKPF